MTVSKIATCCYCGTRATLVLTGKVRHELACSNCGAPLHDLKMLRADHSGPRELVKPWRTRERSNAPVKPDASERRRKGKRRKGRGRRFLEKAWDIVEDVVEDVVDESSTDLQIQPLTILGQGVEGTRWQRCP